MFPIGVPPRFSAVLFFLLLLSPLAAGEFRRAVPGYDFQFPRDHGSHPDFQTEWWYYTGNLTSSEGREFGFQFTIFRTGLQPPGTEGIASQSPLAARDVFLGHFAISDIANEQHQHWEVIGREGLRQAKASTEKLEIGVEGLQSWQDEEGALGLVATEVDSIPAGLILKMTPEKPFVLHGENGVHQKAADAGQASHYISFTRLKAEGRLLLNEEVFDVSGLAWMDHEFGSDQLSAEQVGWDWFALQLDTGEDLMVYGVRERDGSWTPHSVGTLVGVDGEKEFVPSEDFAIEALSSWTSPETGATYPQDWVITIPRLDARLRVTPRFADQEMTTERYTGIVYWEGAVAVRGTWRGVETQGKGYVELVGYAEEFDEL